MHFILLKLQLSESREEGVGMGRQPGTQEKEEEEDQFGKFYTSSAKRKG